MVSLELKELLTHLPVSIYWKNHEGVYLGCNERMASITGLSSPRKY